MAQSQYAQPSDLQLVGITPATAGRWGASAIVAHLQAASSRADSYLVSQFTLPLIVSPQGWDMELTQAVCAIAAYRLYRQFGFQPTAAAADAALLDGYKQAIEWLELVRDKKIFPQYADSSGDAVGTDEGGPFVVSDTPVGFTSQGASNGVGSCSSDWWGW